MKHTAHPHTFVSTLTLNGITFLLHFIATEAGYTITCINDKSLEPIYLVRGADGTWQLTGLPGLVTPLLTEKITALVQQHEAKDKEEK